MEVKKSRKKYNLGDESLLQLNMSAAAKCFNVSVNIIEPRLRKKAQGGDK